MPDQLVVLSVGVFAVGTGLSVGEVRCAFGPVRGPVVEESEREREGEVAG